MAKAVQKIKLSPSRDIPFNKLVLAQSNVRRTKAGISIEDLAEDIARRSLLQSLNVRPISHAEGQETGMFEVPAGGRRYRALELLVKQKRLTKTAPVPCIVSEAGTEITAEEDSLAENVHRVALHPLDQFRAFQTLREQGRSEEDIAAIFFVSVNVVKQRLRLAAVSQTLLDIYANDGMSLEQLMAFSGTAEHARQEQVWESVNKSGYDEPYQIRRLLTERAVRASDKRARFVGLAAYEEAGGSVPAALITGIRSDLPGQTALAGQSNSSYRSRPSDGFLVERPRCAHSKATSPCNRLEINHLPRSGRRKCSF
jgi:ParB family chromosome partitioning protein